MLSAYDSDDEDGAGAAASTNGSSESVAALRPSSSLAPTLAPGPPLKPSPLELSPLEPSPLEPSPLEPSPLEPSPLEPSALEPSQLQPTSPLRPSRLQASPLQASPLQASPLQALQPLSPSEAVARVAAGDLSPLEPLPLESGAIEWSGSDDEYAPPPQPQSPPSRLLPLSRSDALARVAAGDRSLHTLVCAGLPRMGVESMVRENGYDSDNSDFEHGEQVHELRTGGRHSKLEGHFFGSEQRGSLTLHTKFTAAHGASNGYKTLERGMWVDCPGVPYEEVQLVRIISGDVAESGKTGKRHVVLLFAVSEDEPEWFYAPMKLVEPLDGGPLFSEGGPCHGACKWMFNCDRHAADRALHAWKPEAIKTLARKASALTPRKSRGTKRK
jgi:hypothetical protein